MVDLQSYRESALNMSVRKHEGKVAVVTGAGGTLCSVIAEDLARQGASVALLGRSETKLQPVLKAITDAGGEALALSTDVTDLASLEATRNMIANEMGTCDILVNGAGGNQAEAITRTVEFDPAELDDPSVGGFFNLNVDAFRSVVDTNLTGTMLPSRVFGMDMARKRKGVILNFPSMTSYRPLTKVCAYACAKAAVVNLTQWLAAYLAPAGVRVNGVAPGFFVNERSRRLLYNPDNTPSERGRQVLLHTPMNRFGEASELLGTVNWLLDDEASGFVTGITVPVDGGFLASAGV